MESPVFDVFKQEFPEKGEYLGMSGESIYPPAS
jgi:hypothetical protein